MSEECRIAIERAAMAEAVFYLNGLLSYLVPRAKAPTRAQVFAFLTGKYIGAWNKAYEAAIDEAIKIWDHGESTPVSNADIQEIIDAIDNRMVGDHWFTSIEQDIERAILLDYALGKKSASKGRKARAVSRAKKKVSGITVNWEALIDDKAVEWLKDDNLYWVENHYSEQVAGDIAKIANEIGLKQGLGRKEVAKALRAAFSDRFDQSLSYWQGLSATVLTRSSVMGTTQALIEAEAKTYEFLSVNDERTSEICRHLDGKVFKVDVARDIRDRLLNSKSPEDAKEITPWPTGEYLQEALSTSSANDLAAMGIAVPPLHFHCRSEIVVAKF